MDRMMGLNEIARRAVADYVCPSPNATMYLVEDKEHHVGAATSVPNMHQNMVRVVVMARVENDHVIIETDITHKPLYEALLQAGVPQQNIVLAYAGQTEPMA